MWSYTLSVAWHQTISYSLSSSYQMVSPAWKSSTLHPTEKYYAKQQEYTHTEAELYVHYVDTPQDDTF